jgi:N-alpha-acetyltransferase 30
MLHGTALPPPVLYNSNDGILVAETDNDAQALSPEDKSLIGVIVCKLEVHAAHSTPTRRGYIAMLAVASPYRGHGVATALVKMAIGAMADRKADEIVLETEETNIPAMRLYERLGFLRSKKLHRYYLNGSSAYRLVLLLKSIDPDSVPDDFDGQIA